MKNDTFRKRSRHLFSACIKNSMIFWRLKATVESFFHVPASFIEINGITKWRLCGESVS